MAQKTLNRDQIILQIAEELDLPKARVKKIILDFEKEIFKNLKAEGKIRLDHFGMLYPLKRKSRTIKQIKTKNARLLLEQKTIRFRSAVELKTLLTGKTVAKPKAKSPQIKDDDIVIPVKKEPTFTKTVPRERVVKDKRISRPYVMPLKIYQKAEHEKVRKTILERFLKIARENKKGPDYPQWHPPLESCPEGKLFGAIFKTILKDGADRIDFSISDDEKVAIFQAKPRMKIADISRQTVERFLDKFLDLEVFNIPQERFVKLSPSSKIKGKIEVRAYSIPTSSGAAFSVKVKKI